MIGELKELHRYLTKIEVLDRNIVNPTELVDLVTKYGEKYGVQVSIAPGVLKRIKEQEEAYADDE